MTPSVNTTATTITIIWMKSLVAAKERKTLYSDKLSIFSRKLYFKVRNVHQTVNTELQNRMQWEMYFVQRKLSSIQWEMYFVLYLNWNSLSKVLIMVWGQQHNLIPIPNPKIGCCLSKVFDIGIKIATQFHLNTNTWNGILFEQSFWYWYKDSNNIWI